MSIYDRLLAAAEYPYQYAIAPLLLSVDNTEVLWVSLPARGEFTWFVLDESAKIREAGHTISQARIVNLNADFVVD